VVKARRLLIVWWVGQLTKLRCSDVVRVFFLFCSLQLTHHRYRVNHTYCCFKLAAQNKELRKRVIQLETEMNAFHDQNHGRDENYKNMEQRYSSLLFITSSLVSYAIPRCLSCGEWCTIIITWPGIDFEVGIEDCKSYLPSNCTPFATAWAVANGVRFIVKTSLSFMRR